MTKVVESSLESSSFLSLPEDLLYCFVNQVAVNRLTISAGGCEMTGRWQANRR